MHNAVKDVHPHVWSKGDNSHTKLELSLFLSWNCAGALIKERGEAASVLQLFSMPLRGADADNFQA
eukprot:36479-Eustigmatos_ZCMA.PRE.1